MRKFKITSKQLNELLNSDLMFSTDNTTPYVGSEISTTEPVGDDNFGDPLMGDDHANSMAPSPLSRMTNRGQYGGPIIV